MVFGNLFVVVNVEIRSGKIGDTVTFAQAGDVIDVPLAGGELVLDHAQADRAGADLGHAAQGAVDVIGFERVGVDAEPVGVEGGCHELGAGQSGGRSAVQPVAL